MSAPRNPSELTGLTRNHELIRLLCACGTQESFLEIVSDYDSFLILAEAMPLCVGHPLRDMVNHTLQEAIGSTVSLCPHTAQDIWKIWTDIHWYGRENSSHHALCDCPCCAEGKPTVLKSEALTFLADPLTVSAGNMAEWNRVLESSLQGEYILFSLSEAYEFVRPDPYHANLAISKMAVGDALVDSERNLLITQAMRVWGQWGGRIHWKGKILLHGGRPEAVIALLDYLLYARALPQLVWIPRNPSDAGQVCGLYPDVGTGADLSRCQTTEEEQAVLRAYATVSPIGRAVVIRL